MGTTITLAGVDATLDGTGINEVDTRSVVGGRKGDPAFGYMGDLTDEQLEDLPEAAFIYPYQEAISNTMTDTFGAVHSRPRYKNKGNGVAVVFRKMTLDPVSGQAMSSEECRWLKLPLATDDRRNNPLLKDGVTSKQLVRMLAASGNNGVMYYMVAKDTVASTRNQMLTPEVWAKSVDKVTGNDTAPKSKARAGEASKAPNGAKRGGSIQTVDQRPANNPPTVGSVRVGG